MFLSCSTQCISELLQELPTHGLLPVPAHSSSSLPAGSCAAAGEVLHPPVHVHAPQPPRLSRPPRPPRPACHLHPQQPQPAGTPAPAQNHHTPSALRLGLQGLGAVHTPRPQAGLGPGTHLVLVFLFRARLGKEARLRMPEAAEHWERRLRRAPEGRVWRRGRGRPGPGATHKGAASSTTATLLPSPQAEELLHPQCHWGDRVSSKALEESSWRKEKRKERNRKNRVFNHLPKMWVMPKGGNIVGCTKWKEMFWT